MYFIKLRNYAICLDGDVREFLRDTLEEAISDILVTLKQGPDRVGTVRDLNSEESDVIISFYSSDGQHIKFTDYRESDVEYRFGIVGSDLAKEAIHFARGNRHFAKEGILH